MRNVSCRRSVGYEQNLQATSYKPQTTSHEPRGHGPLSDLPQGGGLKVGHWTQRSAHRALARGVPSSRGNSGWRRLRPVRPKRRKQMGRLDRLLVFLLACSPVSAKAPKAKPRHLSESCGAGPGRQAVAGFVVGLFPCVGRRTAAARSLWRGCAPGYWLCAGGFACHGSIAKTPALGEGFGAGSGTRTRTGEGPQRILSPLRLPIPPSRPGRRFFILAGPG